MYQNVMVPLDGSSFAEQALPYAVALARAVEAQVHVVTVHVSRPLHEANIIESNDVIEAQQREHEEQYLAGLVQRLRAELPGELRTSLVTGTAGAALARFASSRRVDLIVMSTHGRGGLSRLWLGSVADALVRRARVPTLLVRPPEDAAAPAPVQLRRVLVAVDGSAEAELALAQATVLCAAFGATCTIVRVVVPPTHVISSLPADTARMSHDRLVARTQEAETYLSGLVARTRGLPPDTRVQVVTGTQDASAILRCAGSEDADVIALGTRGHGRAARLLLGSVADKVIRGSHIPVLVCPTPRRGGAQAGHLPERNFQPRWSRSGSSTRSGA